LPGAFEGEIIRPANEIPGPFLVQIFRNVEIDPGGSKKAIRGSQGGYQLIVHTGFESRARHAERSAGPLDRTERPKKRNLRLQQAFMKKTRRAADEQSRLSTQRVRLGDRSSAAASNKRHEQMF